MEMKSEDVTITCPACGEEYTDEKYTYAKKLAEAEAKVRELESKVESYHKTRVWQHSEFEKVLRVENAVLQKKLEKAIETLRVIANVGETIKLRYEPTWYEDLCSGTLDELDAINAESITKE